jgi:site-specific DNA recombinase
VWVSVQESLERNKSKAYHKPRNNEALLTGLLYCRCGSRMYPKLSKRKTADGQPVYTYVCKMKERSQRSLCNERNANGNSLDSVIVEQIKALDDDKGAFIDQLEQSRKFYTGNRADYDQRLAALRQEKKDIEKKIEALVDSLADLGDGEAKKQVAKRIEALSQEAKSLDSRIHELEGLTSQHALSDIEFDVMRQLLSVFRTGIDEMTVEQKRAAIRTVVRKVIWDGANAHVVLFGAEDGEIDYPDIAALSHSADSIGEDDEALEPFADVDYEEDDRPEMDMTSALPKTHWGENSK